MKKKGTLEKVKRKRDRGGDMECVNGQRKELWREEEKAENAGKIRFRRFDGINVI